MTARTPDDAEFELRKLMLRYAGTFDQHQWPVESQRWVELAFALAARICKRPEADARRVIDEMNLLGLIEVESLAALRSAGSVDTGAAGARRIEQHLLDNGFESEQARELLTALIEAADTLARRFDGKVQRYLRRYGELMLREVSEHFAFSRLKPDDQRVVFTYWLQNVLSMPLPADSAGVRAFCTRLALTPQQLVDEVDKVDLNLALADDLIELEEARREAAPKAA